MSELATLRLKIRDLRDGLNANELSEHESVWALLAGKLFVGAATAALKEQRDDPDYEAAMFELADYGHRLEHCWRPSPESGEVPPPHPT